MSTADSSQVLPDLIDVGLRVVFCGLNPGMGAAESGHHFVGRNNRFWRTIHLAGFTPDLIDPYDDRDLLGYGCGLTTVVDRPTARADEVGRAEFKAAHDSFSRKIAHYVPQHVAFLGKAAYSAISGQPNVNWGLQSTRFGGAHAWVLPNPSGLNRSFSLDDLVEAYRALRIAAF
jgi:TDG/mug DNA glycosylase family protein